MSPTPEQDAPQPQGGVPIVPILVLLGFVAAFAAAYFSGALSYLSFEALKANREALTNWVAANQGLAVVAFITLYATVVALSLPVGAFMTILGGFLFGFVFGGVWVVIGATIGATIVFLLARYILTSFANTSAAQGFRDRAGGFVGRMEEGFRENAFSYLLTLRLVPLFPFWAVNLVPAFLNVPLRTYVGATTIGIIPGTFVYAWVGAGLGSVFDRDETPNLGIIFEPQILLPILGLAALSIGSAVYRTLAQRQGSE